MLTARTDAINLDREVRDSIRVRDRTEDDIDIVEDRNGWCVPSYFPSFFTVHSGQKRKYMQVWKFAEIDESGTRDLE